MTNLPFEDWLASLSDRAPSKGAARGVVTVMTHQPEYASYASASEIARIANISVGGVTRGAQRLGYPGWPALREEFRARYLSSLSRSEIAAQHAQGSSHSGVEESLDADQRALALTASRDQRAVLSSAVAEFAQAHTRLAIGGGSFGCVAQILSMNASLGGYPTSSPGEGASVVNAVARLGPSDFVVALGFWRVYESTISAVTTARGRGARVLVITDHHGSALAQVANHVVTASAEGGAFFPSMTSAVAVVNAFCSELGRVDVSYTRTAVAEAEAEWTRAGLLRHPARS
ncbi:MurR/RpiR family transcriptional regulator [Jiangella endophytica]|uniref:MurR/RpiR family transcriptional regulator n=1 Tax=Jiangella endophytica TaxID=1623398 RepID=UPI000E34F344|nr:MurR/RpiR family transcriptional regulator [Jiangella endophytica]